MLVHPAQCRTYLKLLNSSALKINGTRKILGCTQEPRPICRPSVLVIQKPKLHTKSDIASVRQLLAVILTRTEGPMQTP